MGEQEGGVKREGGVSKNDIMGIAIRPRPVGERREGLLEKVCGRRRRCFGLLREASSSGGTKSAGWMDEAGGWEEHAAAAGV